MVSPQLQQPPPISGTIFCPQKCELHTLTASQLGSFIAFVIGLGVAVGNAIFNSNGKMFEQQYVIIFLVTAMYYFMEAWVLEEDHVQTLRSLPGRLAAFEFSIRVIAVILLAFIAVLPDWFSRITNFDTTDARLYLMAGLYNLFLLWDYILYKGNITSENLVPFWGDFGGFILTISCLINRHWFHGTNSILVLILFLVVGYQMIKSGLMTLLTRIRKRQLLR